MNPMDDQRFFDLAMKVTAQQSSDAEETGGPRVEGSKHTE